MSGIPGVKLSTVGMELPETLSFEDWQEIGTTLRALERSVMWWLGDWLLYGENKPWGKKYAAVESKYGTAADAKWVAKSITFSRRREKLSWSHHREVAACSVPEQDELLNLAIAHKWSMRELRFEVHQRKACIRYERKEGPSGAVCNHEDLHRLVTEGKRFGAIYADPPWLYDNQGTRAATGNHYKGMTVAELCNPLLMPIQHLAAQDSHLHLWTTNAFLFDCAKIFEAWGFEFRSSFVWVKPQIGIGNYWRNSHEIMLTAIRGNAKRFDDHSLKSWLECDRGAHSDKPDQVRSFIERASPTPRLELFGRRQIPGWLVWGNQIERSLFDHKVTEVA